MSGTTEQEQEHRITEVLYVHTQQRHMCGATQRRDLQLSTNF